MGQLEEIFSKCFDIPAKEVHDGIEYQSIESWDSLNHLEFASMVEEEFDIELDMDEIIDMSSVGKIREILRNHGVDA